MEVRELNVFIVIDNIYVLEGSENKIVFGTFEEADTYVKENKCMGEYFDIEEWELGNPNSVNHYSYNIKKQKWIKVV